MAKYNELEKKLKLLISDIFLDFRIHCSTFKESHEIKNTFSVIKIMHRHLPKV
jgi:hypothetical protein